MNLKALRAGCASRGAEVSCKEHVKIKIFISKKEILSIQNDGRDFALKNKNPCSACEFQAKQGISIWGIKLLFFSV